MATRKKKIDEITTLASHLEECPLFDIKHLKHKSLDGFIKHPENFYLPICPKEGLTAHDK